MTGRLRGSQGTVAWTLPVRSDSLILAIDPDGNDGDWCSPRQPHSLRRGELHVSFCGRGWGASRGILAPLKTWHGLWLAEGLEALGLTWGQMTVGVLVTYRKWRREHLRLYWEFAVPPSLSQAWLHDLSHLILTITWRGKTFSSMENTPLQKLFGWSRRLLGTMRWVRHKRCKVVARSGPSELCFLIGKVLSVMSTPRHAKQLIRSTTQYSLLRDAICWKRPQLWATGDWHLHHTMHPLMHHISCRGCWQNMKSPRWLRPPTAQIWRPVTSDFSPN